MTGKPLRDRVCAVTGGGRGIGAELAGWFAADGARVAICARHGEEVQETARLLERQHETTVRPSKCDVSNPAEVDVWIDDVIREFGRLDVVVANAGVLGPIGPLAGVNMEAWLRTLAIDIGGVAAVARAAIPAMVASGFGRIVCLSGGGVGGPRPLLRASAYVAAKTGVVALAEVVGAELAGTGVTINAVAPGKVPTAFLRPVLDAGEDVAGTDLYQAASDTRSADLEPLRELVSYLVTEDAGWLNGRCLSARWERPEVLEAQREAIRAGSRYRLRRVDEDLYSERPGGVA